MKIMIVKTLLGSIVSLVLFNTIYAQTLDKAKLDQFFDRLAEKNKAMGSFVIDGSVVLVAVTLNDTCVPEIGRASCRERV